MWFERPVVGAARHRPGAARGVPGGSELRRPSLGYGIRRVSTVFLAVILLARPDPAAGDEARGGDADRAPRAVPLYNTTIDRGHASISRAFSDAVRRFDHFFGDEYIEEEVRKPWLRLGGGVEWGEGWKFLFRGRLNLYLPLPILEHRLQTFVQSQTEGDIDEQLAETLEMENALNAGLRYHLTDAPDWVATVSGGLRLRAGMPTAFVQPRLAWQPSLDSFRIRLVQSLFWFSDEGLGETTEAALDRLLGGRWLLKSTSRATYSETTTGLELAQLFAVRFRTEGLPALDPYALSLEWATRGHFDERLVLGDKHTLALRVRRSVWREWLRLEVAPILAFERAAGGEGPSRSRIASPSLFVGLEVLFAE